ncbi:MAG: sigma-70 family RNA polymerase sigma factor [Oscillospiraceae bacterium]|nr:sigma-70 family RNA polymerase sigma factor [Oscillospiraceae bacterium]
MRSEQEVNKAIELYSDMILRLCTVYLKNSTDAEDIFQTVFLKYVLHSKPFESPEHEKAWLIRVTINACKDHLKSFFYSRTISMEELTGYAPEITQEQYAVMEAVWSLPRQYRDVIYLHFYEGYTAPEIAGILHRNPNTVYTHLHKGKELLKEALGGALNG